MSSLASTGSALAWTRPPCPERAPASSRRDSAPRVPFTRHRRTGCATPSRATCRSGAAPVRIIRLLTRVPRLRLLCQDREGARHEVVGRNRCAGTSGCALLRRSLCSASGSGGRVQNVRKMRDEHRARGCIPRVWGGGIQATHVTTDYERPLARWSPSCSRRMRHERQAGRPAKWRGGESTA